LFAENELYFCPSVVGAAGVRHDEPLERREGVENGVSQREGGVEQPRA
jgi:hypothetical protein